MPTASRRSSSDWHVLSVADGHLRLNEGVEPYALNTRAVQRLRAQAAHAVAAAGQQGDVPGLRGLRFPGRHHHQQDVLLPARRRSGDAVLRVAEQPSETPRWPRPGQGAPGRDAAAGAARARAGWRCRTCGMPSRPRPSLARAGDCVRADAAEARRQRASRPSPTWCPTRTSAPAAMPPTTPRASCSRSARRRAISIATTPGIRAAEPARAHGRARSPAGPAARPACRAMRASTTPAAKLEDRARAYLDVNCGHCHNPKGPADTSGLWLDAAHHDPRRLGLCKPPVAAGRAPVTTCSTSCRAGRTTRSWSTAWTASIRVR